MALVQCHNSSPLALHLVRRHVPRLVADLDVALLPVIREVERPARREHHVEEEEHRRGWEHPVPFFPLRRRPGVGVGFLPGCPLCRLGVCGDFLRWAEGRLGLL